MPAITASVTLRIPADVLERVDAARGDMSRNLWMVTALRMVVDSPAAGGWFSKGAVEQALGPTGGDLPALSTPPRGDDLAPAEQPQGKAQSAAERALSEAKGPFLTKQADPGSVPSSEGVRSATPAGQPVDEECEDQQWIPTPRPFRPYPKGGKR